jgi:hypothetical protein
VLAHQFAEIQCPPHRRQSNYFVRQIGHVARFTEIVRLVIKDTARASNPLSTTHIDTLNAGSGMQKGTGPRGADSPQSWPGVNPLGSGGRLTAPRWETDCERVSYCAPPIAVQVPASASPTPVSKQVMP